METEAVDEAIAKNGYDREAIRDWLGAGSSAYHNYLRMMATATSDSTSNQKLEPDLAKKDEVTAERDEEKEKKRPVRGSVQQDQPTQRATIQAVSAKPSTSEVTPSDPSRIATLADIERFMADFDQRLKKLEEHAFGSPSQVNTAENPVPGWPAERQKPLNALSKAGVTRSESGEGSGGSGCSSGSGEEVACVYCGGHEDMYCIVCHTRN